MNRARLAADFAAQQSRRFDDLAEDMSKTAAVDRVAADFYVAMAAAASASYVLSLGDALAYPSLRVATGFGTVGRLDLVLSDPDLAKIAEAALRPLDLGESVRVHRGTPAQVVPGINGPYDLVMARIEPAMFLELYDYVVRLLRTGGSLLLGPWHRAGDDGDEDQPRPEGEAELLERLAEDSRFVAYLPATESPLIAVRRR